MSSMFVSKGGKASLDIPLSPERLERQCLHYSKAVLDPVLQFVGDGAEAFLDPLLVPLRPLQTPVTLPSGSPIVATI